MSATHDVLISYSNIEANFIIICGCLPYLRQLLRHYFPDLQESSLRTIDRMRRRSGVRDNSRLTSSAESPSITKQRPSFHWWSRDIESNVDRPEQTNDMSRVSRTESDAIQPI
jgi:hypothetical protein